MSGIAAARRHSSTSALRLAAALTSCLIAIGAAGAANAQVDQASGGGVGGNLERAVRDAFTDMERVMRPCVEGRVGRSQIDVRFIGIPLGDPRISEGLRDAINARFVSTINQISPYVANPYEVNKLLPKLSPGTTVGGERLVAAINAQIDSPMVAIVEPSRPTPDVVTLKFQLLGRAENGVFGCPQERLMHIALPALTITERPARDLDLRTFDGFADAALTHLTPGLLDLTSLAAAFAPRAGMEGQPLCRDVEDLMTRLRARYYAFRRSEAIAALGTQRLPGLAAGNYVMGAQSTATAEGQGAEATQVVLHVSPDAAEGIYFAGLVLTKGAVEVEASYARIALERPLDPACLVPPAPETTETAKSEGEGAGSDGQQAPQGSDGSGQTGATDGTSDTGVAQGTDGSSSPGQTPETPGKGACITYASTASITRSDCLKPGDIFRDCDACPQMVVVAPGSFRMGGAPGETGYKDVEGPQKDVTIGQPFAIGRFEITREEYAIFADDSGHKPGDHCYFWSKNGRWQKGRGLNFAKPGFAQDASHPAVCISHADARAYLAWLNGGLGMSEAEGYRLPSEAEWEYAARAGEAGAGWASEADLAKRAHFRKEGSPVQLPGTAPAGSFAANAFGLHDMLGNAWEWVADCWIDSLHTLPEDGSARTRDCTYATHHGLRGGSWNDAAEFNRFAKRSYTLGTAYSQDVGFRIAKPLFFRVPGESAEAPAGAGATTTRAAGAN
ncbi:MAG: SUMF1/EgtB/PvdO family nonheme iron enzyme [Rhizobiales bacterium]|nr:SUMF1/EgtB/PvdO family nonheme iron enzyme [Hyphomicrobiales bacterium]